MLCKTVILLTVFTTCPAISAEQSNVIVIISDDAGYADFGFQNQVTGRTSVVPTPNLDALANRGVTFSRSYVAANCQPTRAAIVTGGYQQRIGNESVGNNLTFAVDDPRIETLGYEGVPQTTQTIWDRLGGLGYSTAAVGKWHLGSHANSADGLTLGNRPENQGIDEFYGHYHGSRSYNVGAFNLSQVDNPDSPLQARYLRSTIRNDDGTITDTVLEGERSGEYITNSFGDFAVDFIGRKAQANDPFFLYQSFTAPHAPWDTPSPDENNPEFLNAIAGLNLTPERRRVAAMMFTMDREIGRILASVNDPNGDGDTSDSIADNTTIVFVNDNGGVGANPLRTDNGPLSGTKGSPLEGGIRVPFIIAGAGIDEDKQGTVFDRPVHGVDILPTAVALGGGTIGPEEDKIDGVNLLPFINGEETADPHDVLVHRWRGTFSVIKGDVKLVNRVNNGATPNRYELYNVVEDISETNNLANDPANAELIAELQRDLTEHEAEFDKPRFAILGNTPETEPLNLFDHFKFRPGQASAAETRIIDRSQGNGDFSEGGTSPSSQTFEQTAEWFNASGSEGIVFTRDTQLGGSSDQSSVTRGGAPVDGVVSVNATGYEIQSEGEQFSISYDFGAGGPGSAWNGDETVELFLFTTSEDVNGDLTVSNITEIASDVYQIDRANDGQWTTRIDSDLFTSQASDVGTEVFLGIRFDSGVGSQAFPRIDIVSLSVETPGGSGVARSLWSDTDGWFQAGTDNAATLYRSDGFAGAVVEFPTSEVSYIAENDLVRRTGLEFMLNKIVLSGQFSESENRFGRLEGNSLLFTNDLDGNRAEIVIDATNLSGGEFSYEIDLDVILFDDITLTGDGDALLTISGQVRDYYDSRGLTKSGESTVVLSGDNTYSGDTVVEGGTLTTTTAFLADAADVYLAEGAAFNLEFSGVDTIDSLFINGVSQAAGLWGAIGSGADNESALITGTGFLLVSTGGGVSGDFNGDGVVDAADFALFRDNVGGDGSALNGNGSGEGVVGLADYNVFQGNFGGGNTNSSSAATAAVPEPSACLLAAAALLIVTLPRARVLRG